MQLPLDEVKLVPCSVCKEKIKINVKYLPYIPNDFVCFRCHHSMDTDNGDKLS